MKKKLAYARRFSDVYQGSSCLMRKSTRLELEPAVCKPRDALSPKYFCVMLKEVIRRVRPSPSLETPHTRSSILPVDHLTMPSFRWWDGDKIPTHHKSPLLGLKLSSNSFLDSSLEDDLSATTVYTIKTIEASTTVLRYGNEHDPLEIATINWPGAASTIDAREDDNPPLVKMKDCRWIEGPAFLRSGSHPKYVNNSYHLVSRFQTFFKQQLFSQIHHSRLFS